VAQARDAQLRVDRVPPELVVLAHRRDLGRRSAQLDVAAELGVRIEKPHVEALYAVFLLHAPADAQRRVEHLERPLLTARHGRPPGDEQHAIGHADSSRHDPAQGPGLVCLDPPTASRRRASSAYGRA